MVINLTDKIESATDENTINVTVDTGDLTQQVKSLTTMVEKLEEKLTSANVPITPTEQIVGETQEDYRDKLIEKLKGTTAKSDFKWTGKEDNEEADLFFGGAVALSAEKKAELKEAIGAVTATNAVPEIWAAEVERLSVYPNSGFYKTPYVNWKTDIKGAGDTVNVITVAPVSSAALACEEPTNTAATIGKVPVTLVNRNASYYICKTDMEDIVPSTITALNAGLSTSLVAYFDQYFLSQAQVGANLGTLAEATGIKGTMLAKALGSLGAGTYRGAVCYIHPVVWAGLLQDSQFTNAATFGERGVIASGNIPKYLGVDIVPLPQGTLNLGGGTYRSLLMANGAMVGVIKRELTVETEYVARLQQKFIIASTRFGGTVAHPNGIFWITTVQS